MNGDIATIGETIIQRIDDGELRRIEGWDGIEAFVERVAVHAIDIDSIEGTERKWSVRGMVSVHMFNWDDERCGELRLHLIASGHKDGARTVVNDLLISPHMH